MLRNYVEQYNHLTKSFSDKTILGKGSSSEVHEVFLNGMSVAVKIILKTEIADESRDSASDCKYVQEFEKSLSNELFFFRKVGEHKNIIRFFLIIVEKRD